MSEEYNNQIKAEVFHLLWSIECQYWEDVDLNGGATASEFYTSDGIFDIGLPGARFEGRENIKRFYEQRKNVGVRTTRHIITNFHLTSLQKDLCSSRSIMTLFGADGSPPRKSGLAYLIADFQTSYEFVNERWLVSKRLGTVCFLDESQNPMSRILTQP